MFRERVLCYLFVQIYIYINKEDVRTAYLKAKRPGIFPSNSFCTGDDLEHLVVFMKRVEELARGRKYKTVLLVPLYILNMKLVGAEEVAHG